MDIEFCDLRLLGFDFVELISTKTIPKPFIEARCDEYSDYIIRDDESKATIVLDIESNYIPEYLIRELMQDSDKLRAIINSKGIVEVKNKSGVAGLRVINGYINLSKRLVRDGSHPVNNPDVFDYKLNAELTCVTNYFTES